MIGQSNMAGRGRFGEVEEIKQNGKMFMLRNGRWQIMSEPVNVDRCASPYSDNGFVKCGIGLAPSFAECYSNTYNREIGLIPCADGGSSLNDWVEGGLLYDHAVFQAKLAQRTSEIKGILWHQGENDSQSEENVQNYKSKFYAIMNGIKKQLNIDVPIIIGEIGRFVEERHPLSRKINEVLNHIAAKDERIGIASSDGLSDMGDRIHFNSASYRILGRRYFEEYQNIVIMK